MKSIVLKLFGPWAAGNFDIVETWAPKILNTWDLKTPGNIPKTIQDTAKSPQNDTKIPPRSPKTSPIQAKKPAGHDFDEFSKPKWTNDATKVASRTNLI